MNNKSRGLTGIFILSFGIILLLGFLNILDARDIFITYWPIYVIMYGIFAVLDKKSSTMWGIIVIIIGGYFQLYTLGIYILKDIELSKIILPLIIILIGIKIIINSFDKK